MKQLAVGLLDTSTVTQLARLAGAEQLPVEAAISSIVEYLGGNWWPWH